jgi:GrpB-like predicted nucleotidyltransferase (UPF0157 family)
MIGLKRHTVELACHSDSWLAYGRAKCDALRNACLGIPCEVQHVGSTSVPGLPAKPIIDLVIGLLRMTDLELVKSALEGLGYIYRGIGSGSIGHLFVLESAPNVRTEHLHVIPAAGEQWDSYVKFKDALTSSPGLVQQYAALKQSLRSKFSNDRKEYTAGKAQFIQTVLAAQQGAPPDAFGAG